MEQIMILEDDDEDYIWEIVQQQQTIFHPDFSPTGKFDYKKFFETKRKKPIILFVDRNILSGLIKFCEQGSLRDKGESQLIGIVMTWAILNGISISAGPAVQERATQINKQREGLIELNKFLEIFEYYPSQLWLLVAKGQITEIPKIDDKLIPAKDITAIYSEGNDHYYMALASLIHIVKLYRNRCLSPVAKIKDFIQWTYDNLLVSQYLFTYVIMLFTNQEYIKAPKNSRSNDYMKVVDGCENQAWDIAYLSVWSTFYSNTDCYAEEFVFATNDILLKRIFINAHGVYGVNGLLHEVLSQRDYDMICDVIEERIKNRIKPEFGEKPKAYFLKLIEKEKKELINSMRE